MPGKHAAYYALPGKPNQPTMSVEQMNDFHPKMEAALYQASRTGNEHPDALSNRGFEFPGDLKTGQPSGRHAALNETQFGKK